MNRNLVDVMVCTYNTGSILDKCLSSIRENIPVNTLWVIDKYSTDGTIDIARNHQARIVQDSGGILEARALGFRLVETELFVNIDSDIVLPRHWYDDMMKFWEPDLDCLWGITIEQSPLHRAYIEAMYRVRSPVAYRITHLPVMIARKNVLSDIRVPEALKKISFGNDDAYIYRWMHDIKHCRIKTAPVRAKHYSWGSPIGTKSFWFGAGTRKTGLTKFRAIVLRSYLAFPQACFAALISRKAMLIPYWIRFRFECMYGWLHWNKYVDLKRTSKKEMDN